MSSKLDANQIIQLVGDEVNQALQVNVVASTGLPPGHADGTAHTPGDVGLEALAVRNDAGTALAADGEYIPLTTDASGALRVNATVTEGATVANGGALPAVVKVVAGYDGTNVRVVKTNAAGELQVDVLTLPALSQAVSSIKIGDGTDLLSITAAGEANVIATAQPGVDIGDVTINNAAGASSVNIQDGGNSLTVDAVDLDIRDLTSVSDSISAVQSGTWDINDISGIVSLPTGASTSALQTAGNTILSSIELKLVDTSQFTKLTDGTDTALITAAGELTVLSTAQAGVDIGDVTINNAAGASAVNIQDGGNSLTVDGAVTVSATDLDIRDLTSVSDSVSAVQSGTWDITNISGTVSLPTGASTLAEQQTQTTSLQLLDDAIATAGVAITAKANAVAGTDGTNARILKTNATGNLQVDVVSTVSGATLSVVDFLDIPLFDATTINDSAGAFVEGVTSLAAAVKKIQVFDTSGAFIGIYTGAAASEVLAVVSGPGNNETTEISIPAATRISFRSLETTAPTAGYITINFIG